MICRKHQKPALSICLRQECPEMRLLCQQCAIKEGSHRPCNRHIVALGSPYFKERLISRLSSSGVWPSSLEEQAKELKLYAQQKYSSIQSRVLKILSLAKQDTLHSIDDILATHNYKRAAELALLVSTLEQQEHPEAVLGEVMAYRHPLTAEVHERVTAKMASLKQRIQNIVEFDQSQDQVQVVLRKCKKDSSPQHELTRVVSRKSVLSTRACEEETRSQKQQQVSKVQFINLEGIRVTHKSMLIVASLTSLRYLYMEGCELTDQLCKHLAGLLLVVLDLTANQVCFGVSHLQDSLEELSLYQNKVSDEAVRSLIKLKKLKRLDLYGNKLTRKGMAQLTELQCLTQLNLYNNLEEPDISLFFKQQPNVEQTKQEAKPKEVSSSCHIF